MKKTKHPNSWKTLDNQDLNSTFYIDKCIYFQGNKIILTTLPMFDFKLAIATMSIKFTNNKN